jgi:hypothetical protein
MSHFAVIVFTEQYPTKEVLDKTLAPWHEYECTGHIDEYVIHIDSTKDALNSYENGKEYFVRSPDGTEHLLFKDGNYNNLFYRKENTLGFDEKVKYIPEGYVEFTKPLKDCGVSIIEHIKSYYGCDNIITESDIIPKEKYILVDKNQNFLKYFEYTNPNAKWDWWQIGGRYTGRLDPLYDPEKDPRNQEIRYGKLEVKWPTEWVKHDKDIIQVKNIKIDEILNHYRKQVGEQYDKFMIGFDKNFKLFDEIEEADLNKKRIMYRNQPAIMKQSNDIVWLSQDKLKMLRDNTREEYIEANCYSWFVPYAFIHDGNWYEKGEMGWFGCSTDKVSQEEWDAEVNKLLNEVDETTLITIVDCHI